MGKNSLFRVLGAIMILLLTATACGSDTTETSADADDQPTATSTVSGDSMSDDDKHDDEHGASTIDVDTTKPIPEVAIILNETDEPGMFDLRVVLANFTITPENVDGDPVDNEGHMHLLIDGEKIDRFTDLERQIMVPEGEHLVEVELNANNHLPYAVDGVPIRTGMTVIGAGEASMTDEPTEADVTITATLTDGEVTLDGDERVEVAVGDVVMLMISSDVAEEAHLHGYDILAEVGPDKDGMILFTADTPGRFEIEFETSGKFIAELTVS